MCLKLRDEEEHPEGHGIERFERSCCSGLVHVVRVGLLARGIREDVVRRGLVRLHWSDALGPAGCWRPRAACLVPRGWATDEAEAGITVPVPAYFDRAIEGFGMMLPIPASMAAVMRIGDPKAM